MYMYFGPCSCFCCINSGSIIMTLMIVCLENGLVGK
jgi:hypothetical protein